MDFGLDIEKDFSSEPSEIDLQVSYSLGDFLYGKVYVLSKLSQHHDEVFLSV